MNRLIASSLLIASMLACDQARANFIVNGDFEQGNVGFQTQYAYLSGVPYTLSDPGNYTVTTTPSSFDQYWNNFGDHTTGAGKMLCVDGSQNPSQYFWQEAISGLVAGATYTFTGWVASPDDETGLYGQLKLVANGTQFGPIVNAPNTYGTWMEFTSSFVASSSTVTLQMFDEQTHYTYNDFLLDDFSLVGPAAVPEPASVALMAFGLAAVAASSGLRRRACIAPGRRRP